MAAEIRSSDVRAWAKANGIKVSDRGRLSTEALEAYQAANGTTAGAKRAGRAAEATSGSRAPRPGNKSAAASTPNVSRAASRGEAAPAPAPAAPVGEPLPTAPSNGDLAEVVRRIGELEAQVASLTERLDAAVSALTKRGRQFRLSRR